MRVNHIRRHGNSDTDGNSEDKSVRQAISVWRQGKARQGKGWELAVWWLAEMLEPGWWQKYVGV